MKRHYFLAAILCAFATMAYAQQPTTKDSIVIKKNNDTIRIGSILIIKRHKKPNTDSSVTVITDDTYININKKSKRSTNYLVFDIGFGNWDDQTNYANTSGYVFSKPGVPAFSADDMKLRAGKSTNINIWLFMQKLALVKRNVNLKYGLGFEFDNYSFRSPVSLKEGGPLPYSVGGIITNAPFVFRDSISFSKNKLNLKYLTVPLMLNFATTKQKGKRVLVASFGVSAGYLFRQRNKQNSNERGKQKNQGDYDLQRFKLSYIAEVGLGPIRLYGSYSPKSIFEKGLDIRPYSLGVRFSNW
jgi:Outer membrane protein beta-barrel domain